MTKLEIRALAAVIALRDALDECLVTLDSATDDQRATGVVAELNDLIFPSLPEQLPEDIAVAADAIAAKYQEA